MPGRWASLDTEKPMQTRAIRWIALCALLLVVAPIAARPAPTRDLPLAAPEAEGVNPEALAARVAYLNSQPHDIRSIQLVRNGHNVFDDYEGWIVDTIQYLVASIQ